MTTHDDLTALPPVWSEEEFMAELTELAVSEAPRRFALCEVEGERWDGWVHGWGMEFPDGAVFFAPGSRQAGVFTSAQSALVLFSRSRNLRLVWIDPEPDAQTG
ncbi:hypothetical protein LI90_1720 [Carbonactinospora thermoautotrophica]|uniref:Uncharacterized protein n=1 Tax=Carbonactinospora thermoautotrophica TaxID=1469144 RepID=A0A132MS56_9ACTN|nr:hypothetical protein [Carbonactinospora thermoautotrophica]KWX00697.1 hypothetical protein LI90_1720 [Carbonactinospora thermoautotrophica]